MTGDLPTVEWIVNSFPDLAYMKDNSGNLPIHLAAAGGKVINIYKHILVHDSLLGAVDIVKFLIERYGRDYAIQSGSEKKFQPLYYAVDKGVLYCTCTYVY